MRPISSGQAARFLNVLEPRLADLVRRGKIHPRPRVVAGRRAWEAFHIIQAARELGLPLDPEQVEALITEEVDRGDTTSGRAFLDRKFGGLEARDQERPGGQEDDR